MKMKKATALILILSLAAGVFFGCSPAGQGGGTEGELSGAGTSESTAPVTTEISPDYPDADFTGKTFMILVSGHTSVNAFNDFGYDENAASVFDDAIYRRNAKVEEQFGIKVETTEDFLATPATKTLLIKNQSAGDNLYDAVMPIAYDAGTLAYSGYLYDLNSLPTLDLSHPWWDQKANRDLEMNGIMFFTTGDYGIFANNVTYCITFNKDMAQSYDVGDLYDLADTGKWTLDALSEAATKVSGDLNNDGKYDVNDLYGLTTWDDASYGIVNAAGSKICSINSEGKIELTLNNERTESAIEKYVSLISKTENCTNFQHLGISPHDSAIMQLFGEGNSLFLMIMFKNLSAFRDTDLNYGILPYPKLDETQDEYYTTIAPWHTNFMAVPYVIEDELFSGTVVEALCYESRSIITEAYYEKTLVGRTVRDDESIDMLNLIFATRVFDIGLYYKPGGLNSTLINLIRNKSADFASAYATAETAAKSMVTKLNGFFESALAEWQ